LTASTHARNFTATYAVVRPIDGDQEDRVKQFKPIAAGVASVLMLAACANDGSSSSKGGGDNSGGGSGPIKIGVIVPLSGPAGPNGKDVLQSIKVEVGLINQAGGVLGRKVQVVAKDDQSNPATGVSAANALASSGVSVVMGGWNSPVTLAIQPVLVRANILNITTIPQNASIIGGADPDAVRLNAGNAVGAYSAAEFLTKTLHAKRVGMLLENDAYGSDAGDYLAKELQKSGAKVTSTQKFAYTDTDFRVPLSKLAGASVDAVFSADAAESSGMPALAKQYATSGVKAPHFAGLGTVSPKVVKLAGGSAIDGLYSADIYFPQAPPFSGYPDNQAFIKAYTKASGGELPDKYRALGAEGVDIWAQAVKSANSLDRAKVAAAIHGHSFTNTILGDVSFTAKGQMISKVYGFTVKNGQVSVLDEIPVPDSVWNQ
jgi:branched-chain amino acid transport system substrate-binding protein